MSGEKLKTNKNNTVKVGALVILSLVSGIWVGANYLNKSVAEFNKLENKNSVLNSRIEKIKKTNSEELHNIQVKYDKSVEQVNSLKDKVERISKRGGSSFITVNKEMLAKDLDRYKFLSTRNKKIIIDTVIQEASKYGINPIILYSLLHIETSMEFWKQHALTSITLDNGKTIKVRAVGLGGVIWEWQKEHLIKAKIAFSRSDLFDPKINIQATALVMDIMSKRSQLKGTKSKDESMLRRYFGGNYKSYSDKIDKKVMSIVRPNLYRY